MAEGKGRYYPVSKEGEAQSQYGNRRPRIGRKRFNLDEAREDVEENIGGDILWAVRASSYNALLEISLHEQGNGQIPFQKGTMVRVGPFSQIYLTNEPQPGEWVEIVFARQTVDFVVENPGSTFDTVQIGTPTVLTGYSDVNIAATSSTQVIGSGSNRKEVILRSLSSNTNTVRLADSSVASNLGIPLEPGQTITLNVTEEIYAYNLDDTSDGTDVTIAIVEIEK